MEHRETSRTASAEGRPREVRTERGAEAHRFARFVTSPTERRLVLGRLGMAVATSVLALLVAGLVGTHVFEGMIRWLHGLPQYRTSFRSIELDPPPPEFYRGGSSGFLDKVRQASRRPDEPFSNLDVAIEELGRDFRLYCWVKGARVKKRPLNRLIVNLEYRTPVARANLPGTPARVLVDEEGVILPYEDLGEEKASRLILLVGFEAPLEPTPGLVWKGEDAPGKENPTHERVLDAVKLAEFLDSAVSREPKPIAAGLRPFAIVWDPKTGLWVENAQMTMIHWSRPGAQEAPWQAVAQRQWAALRDWFAVHPVAVGRPEFLDFTKNGVEIKRGK